MRSRVTASAIVVLFMASVVPSAAAAAAAGVKVVDAKATDAGEGVTLLKTDEFKVTGECVDRGSGDFEAETFLAARKNNLAVSGTFTETDEDFDFDKTDPKINILNFDAEGLDPDFETAEWYDFYGEGRGTSPLRGRLATSVHMGSDCAFSGIFTGVPGKGPLHTTKRIEVNLGERKTIYSNRDFRVVGSCEDVGFGGQYRANTSLEAKRGGAMYHMPFHDVSDTDFGPEDGGVDITPQDPESNVTAFSGDSFDHEFFAVGRAGILQARLGAGVFLGGADCTFSGIFTGPGSDPGFRVRYPIKLDGGETKTLFENSDFEVTATCENDAPGFFEADASVRAKRRHLRVSADTGLDLDFNPSDGPFAFLEEYANGNIPAFVAMDHYMDFYGEGKGGAVLSGRVATGVNVQGADCVFGGIFAG